MKNSIHFIMQGKGGVGKSLVSAMVAQYLIKNGYSTVCADTDPVNTTFAQIKGLGAKAIKITENGEVRQTLFDPLFETMLETDLPIVVDNGASTFMPLTKYMRANEVFPLLAENGKISIIHSIITGGQAQDDTLNGLSETLDMIDGQSAKVVVWQNDFFGEPNYGNKAFENLPFVKANQHKILGKVQIVDRKNDAFTNDLRLMSQNHMTLNDVNDSADFGLFAKTRIFRVFNEVFAQLDTVFQKTPVEA